MGKDTKGTSREIFLLSASENVESGCFSARLERNSAFHAETWPNLYECKRDGRRRPRNGRKGVRPAWPCRLWLRADTCLVPSRGAEAWPSRNGRMAWFFLHVNTTAALPGQALHFRAPVRRSGQGAFCCMGCSTHARQGADPARHGFLRVFVGECEATLHERRHPRQDHFGRVQSI